MAPKVWLVTGCSRGFGEQFIKTIIKRGDKAIATARDIKSIQKFKDIGAATVQLDVSADPEELQGAVTSALKAYGHIDILVHNAGYGHLGALEDLSPGDVLAEYQTNVFGVINLTQAVLPHFREQKSGHIVLISSVASFMALPAMGAYIGSKAAIEGHLRALDNEIRPLGIKTLILQPGTYRTDIRNVERTHASDTIHHKQLIDGMLSFMAKTHGTQNGSPEKFANIMMDLVKGEGVAAGKEVPLVMPMGQDSFDQAEKQVEVRTKTLSDWGDVIMSTDYDEKSAKDSKDPW